jgi:[ribosomal protein S5]-alanine N-acetyltransferase
MIQLESKRLLLIPLNRLQLEAYCRNDGSLEAMLGVPQAERDISDDLREALEQTIVPQVSDHMRNPLFCTLWTIVYLPDRQLAGDLCFTGEPDQHGELEIGYGTYAAFRNRGIMTEAVRMLIGWAEQQPLVRSIYAATLKDNPASVAILRKNGFRAAGETEQLLQWRLQLHTPGRRFRRLLAPWWPTYFRVRQMA